MKIQTLFVLAAAAAVAGCGGSSAGGVTPAPLASQSPAAAPANAQFSIAIPAPPLIAQARKPQYISAATRSVTISLKGGSKLGTFDVSQASSLCKSASDGSRTCVAGVSAPAGNDTFAIATYDQTNGTGNVLASGTLAQTISAASSSTIAVDLTGVTASIKITLAGSMVSSGKPMSIPVIVQALDASGNTIIGAYDRTITVSDADPTGHTSLSATSVTSSQSSVTLNYDGDHMAGSAIVSASASGIAASATQTFQTAPGILAQYDVPPLTAPDGSGQPPGASGIVQGPDGNLWIAAASASAIIKMTPDGHMTTYWTPTPYSFPQEEAVGKDGAIWFTERDGNNIGRITTAGAITEYPVPSQSSNPLGICLGPDGNIWFAEQLGNAIGRVNAGGSITEFPLPASSFPTDLTAGPDGNLWIDENPWQQPSAIVVMSTTGSVVATHPLKVGNAQPYGIITGSDGNLWFGEYTGGVLARMTTSGAVTEYTPPSGKTAGIVSLAVAKDGDIWFAENGAIAAPTGQLGYITPGTSTIHELPLNLPLHVRNVTVDTNGAIWYSGFEPFDINVPGNGDSNVGEVAP